MARPQTFSKKENEKKKQARRLEKQNRKEERKLSGNTNSFEDIRLPRLAVLILRGRGQGKAMP